MITSSIMIYFLVILLLGVPVFFALAAGSFITLQVSDAEYFIPMLMNKFISGTQNYTLLAICFFILAGNIMGQGGITARIIDFSKSLIGHKQGGLGHVVILSATIYSALTGSAVAATAAIGSMLIPKMVEEGYSKGFSAGITAAATVLGPIIPPSSVMIIYAYAMNISVIEMFAAAIFPGVLFCIALMCMNFYQCKKHGFLFVSKKATKQEIATSFKDAIWALLTPVIILGGIYGGILSTTEAAAVAALYSIIICMFVYKTIDAKKLFEIFKTSTIASANIFLLVGFACAFGALFSLTNISNQVNDLLQGITTNPYLLFAIINVILLLIGMFLDATPAILIFGSILSLPLISLGVDPVHFGVVMSINLTVGLATPPMGLVLFVASNISDVPVDEVTKYALPFVLAEVVIVFLISFFPELVMTLPRLMGF